MKKLKMTIYLLLLLSFLGACTQGHERDLAIAEAGRQFEAEIVKELGEQMSPKHPLFGTYINFIQTSSEFKVVDVAEMGEDTKVVQVNIVTVPRKQRRVLADIANKQSEEHKAKSFNLGTALNLIEQQQGMQSEEEVLRKVIRLKKTGDSWKADGGGAP